LFKKSTDNQPEILQLIFKTMTATTKTKQHKQQKQQKQQQQQQQQLLFCRPDLT